MGRRSIRTGWRPLRLAALLLGGMLVLAGCKNQSGSGERRDGFYGGVSGGWTRP